MVQALFITAYNWEQDVMNKLRKVYVTKTVRK